MTPMTKDARKAKGLAKRVKQLARFAAEVAYGVENLGRIGLVARGVVFALIGIFLIQASLHDDAGEEH